MKPIVTSLINSKASSAASGQMSARSPNLREQKISLKPLSMRELPNWILALAFIICAASGFEKPWIAETPLSQDFQLLQTPVAQPQIFLNLGLQWPTWMPDSSSSSQVLHFLQRKVVQMPRSSLQTSPVDSQTCKVLRPGIKAKTASPLTSC